MATRAPSNPKSKKTTKEPTTKAGAKKKPPGSTAASPVKAGPRKATGKSPGAKAPANARSTRPAAARSIKKTPIEVPRSLISVDDDDELMAHGGGGSGFGRCGGRQLSSRLEQNLCHLLGMAGIVHSHSPRHYEVRYEEQGRVAAYAPQIVLRGRGREGKSVVIEAVEDPNSPILRKIVAFRAQYGQEFYVIVVGTDEVLDEVPLASFDESCSTTNVNTLISRLAE